MEKTRNFQEEANVKFKKVIFIVTFSIVLFMASSPGGKNFPADIYKGGHVRFVPEIILDDNSMPEDIFFNSPVSVTSDNKGNIYICDYRANDIKKFDTSGRFIKVIGREGQGPGEFSWPFEAVFAKDRLIVWDMRNRRLCALTPDGEFIKALKITGETGRPQKMRALPNGDIVIGFEKIYFGQPDKPQDYLIEIYSPEMKPKRAVYFHEIWRNKYIRGDFGLANVPQPFAPLVYWDVSPEGKIIIGYSAQYEINIYDSSGQRLSSFTHSYKKVKVTAEDKKLHFEGMTFSRGGAVTQGAPDFIIKNTKFPKYKPAFNNLLVDSEGNILIHVYPKNRKEMYRYFDAFDPEGHFMANVQVKGNVLFPSSPWIKIEDGAFWLIKTGEDELIKVIKYRISD
ncbi:MAG: 6-bladed beta-propeller [Candidatus Aminicenantales bacterium]